jgi:hypothetical protein
VHMSDAALMSPHIQQTEGHASHGHCLVDFVACLLSLLDVAPYMLLKNLHKHTYSSRAIVLFRILLVIQSTVHSSVGHTVFPFWTEFTKQPCCKQRCHVSKQAYMLD